MKKELAFKSKSEIFTTILTLIIAIVVVIMILRYYSFVVSDIVQAIQITLIVIIFIILVSIFQLIMLIKNPKVMIEYDDVNIYYYPNTSKTKTIAFDEIQDIYTKISIWKKPFVVYTAIVIVIQEETFYLRHMSKMNEVKEFIQNIAYHEDQK